MSLLRCAGLKAVAHPVYNPKLFVYGWLAGWIACDGVFTRAEALYLYSTYQQQQHRSITPFRAETMCERADARLYGVNVLNEGAERRNKMRTTHTRKHIIQKKMHFPVFMSTQQPESSKRAVKESFSAMWTIIFEKRHTQTLLMRWFLFQNRLFVE